MKRKFTNRQLAAVFRMSGFILAAVFLIFLKRGGEELPDEGFNGKAFYNLMIAIGALVFTIGSVLRFRDIMKNQKTNENNQ